MEQCGEKKKAKRKRLCYCARLVFCETALADLHVCQPLTKMGLFMQLESWVLWACTKKPLLKQEVIFALFTSDLPTPGI